MMRRAVAALTATGLAMAAGACDFSAGVGDQASQQREVRTLAVGLNESANVCGTAWLAQRDLGQAAQQGNGDRAQVLAAVQQAEQACRQAATGFQDARPPAIVNSDNQALMRTALANCQTAYADVASHLAIKANVLRQADGWTSPAHEAAVQRMYASMATCETSWTAAMEPLQLQSVRIAAVRGPAADAATDASVPASGVAPVDPPFGLTPVAPGQAGDYGKLPPGGAPAEAPVVEAPVGPPEPEQGK